MKKNKKILVGAALLSASLLLMGCENQEEPYAVYGPPPEVEKIEGRPKDISDVYGPPIAEQDEIEGVPDLIPPVYGPPPFEDD